MDERAKKTQLAYEEVMRQAQGLRETIEKLKKVIEEHADGRTHSENPDAPRS